MIDIATTIDIVSRGGLVAALLIALIGGMRGWYLWKGSHETITRNLQEELDRTIEDRNFWRNQAMNALTTAKTATQLANKNTQEVSTT